MKLPQFPVEGGCQCGAVRYRLKGPPLVVYACHCKDCQRFSGTTHTLSMFAKAGDVELISGELRGYDKAADSGRTVRMLGCPECGTKVWNEPLRLDERDFIDIEVTPFQDLPNLLARLLIGGAKRLLRQGFDRDYLSRREDSQNPRGKIDISGSIKRSLLWRSTVVCVVDDLSRNTLHNQIIRTTLYHLSRASTTTGCSALPGHGDGKLSTVQ